MSTIPSVTSTTSLSSSVPTPTGGNPNNFPGSGPALSSSASLYLYTFLATLSLLLGISAAIIARSYVLRRRQREMIAEAIRNGTYVPPAPIRPKGLGERPKLYDLYLEMDDAAEEKRLVGSSKQNTDWWRGIMPIAADAILAMARPVRPVPPLRRPPRTTLMTFLRGTVRDPEADPVPPVELESVTQAQYEALNDTERVSMAMFIAMPVSRDEHHHQQLPPVEFGLAHVPLRSTTREDGSS